MQPPYDGNNTGWTQAGMPGGAPQPYTGGGLNVPPPVQLPTGGPNQVPPVPQPQQGYAPQMPQQGYAPQLPQQQMPADAERNPTIHQVVDPRGYSLPGTGVKRRRRVRVLPLVLTCAILLAAGVWAAVTVISCAGNKQQPVNGSTGFATVSRSSVSASYSGDALLVRNETVYQQDGITSIDYIAEEGASVVRGDKVCLVYTSGFSQKELTVLEKYRTQIKTYHETLLSKATKSDQTLTGMDHVILARALEARSMIQGSPGNLIYQEKMLQDAMENRYLYLKQMFPDDQKLVRLYEDEKAQEQRISSWTKQYAANAAGLISFYTDGYEKAANMSNYLEMQPGEVRSMIEGNVPDDPQRNKNTVSIYRLVKPDSWGLLMLCDDTAWTPVDGMVYKMVIESFENTVVEATVVSYTKSGNELLVRLKVNNSFSSISNALYIRSCRVRLGESVDTLTVPSAAIYEQQGQRGIVIYSAEMNGPCFVPCTILSDDGTNAYIIPSYQGVVHEGMQVYLYGQKE